MHVDEVFGSIGAVLGELALQAPLGADDQRRLRDLLDEHGVLVMRDQALDEARLIAFSRGLGELATFHEPDKRSATAPEIFRISNVESDGRELRAESDTVADYFNPDCPDESLEV